MFNFLKGAVPELLFRLTIGFVFVTSGWGKFQDMQKVIAYFESLQIPYAQLQAPFVAGVELIAGSFIFVGFLTRLSALPLIVIMLVAIRTALWEDITDFSSLLGVAEYLYIVLLVALAANGSKYVSIDAMILRRR